MELYMWEKTDGFMTTKQADEKLAITFTIRRFLFPVCNALYFAFLNIWHILLQFATCCCLLFLPFYKKCGKIAVSVHKKLSSLT